MNVITGLVIGVAIGWVASMMSGTGGREGLIRNVALGTAGAFIGAWLLNSMSDPADQAAVSFAAISASLVGAAALLLLVNKYLST